MAENAKLSDLFQALLRVQKATEPIKKSADNPFFHSKYAPLEDVLAAVLPALNAEGLVLQQPVVMAEWGWVVASRIVHSETGETTEAQFPLFTEGAKTQDIGAQITYGRRFGLSALLALATEDDDDGNTASAGASQRPAQQAPRQTQAPAPAPTGKVYPATEKQVAFIGQLMRRKLDHDRPDDIHAWLSDFLQRTVSSTKSLTGKEASTVIEHLTALPEAKERITAGPLDDDPPPMADDEMPF